MGMRYGRDLTEFEMHRKVRPMLAWYFRGQGWESAAALVEHHGDLRALARDAVRVLRPEIAERMGDVLRLAASFSAACTADLNEDVLGQRNRERNRLRPAYAALLAGIPRPADTSFWLARDRNTRIKVVSGIDACAERATKGPSRGRWRVTLTDRGVYVEQPALYCGDARELDELVGPAVAEILARIDSAATQNQSP